jgi:hypothetical protein
VRVTVAVVAAVIVWNAPRGDGTGALVEITGKVAVAFAGAGVMVLTTTTTSVAGIPVLVEPNASEGGLLFRNPETATYIPRQQITRTTTIAMA